MPLPVGSGYVPGATVIVTGIWYDERAIIESLEEFGFLHVRYPDGSGQRIHVSNVILEEEG